MRPPFPVGKGAGGIGAQTPLLRTECGAHSCPAPARNGTNPRRGTQPRQPERQRNTPGQPRQASPRARTRRNSAGAGRKKRGRKPPHSPGARSARPPKPAGRAPQGGPGDPRAGRRANPHRRERRPPAREARTEEGRTPGQAGAARHAARGANQLPQKTRLGGLAAARHGTAPDPPQAGRAEKPGGRGGRGQRARPPPPEAPGGRANQPPGQTRKAGLQRRDTAQPQTPRQGAKWRKRAGDRRAPTPAPDNRGGRG